MLFNIAIIFIVALSLNWFCERLKAPGILGMILAGIILGPSCYDFISQDILKFSSDLRSVALVIILIRVSLSVKKTELNKLGPISVKLGLIPIMIETLFISLFAFYFFKMPLITASILGFIISAISPAIIVPEMMNLKDTLNQNKKHIPTILLAAAALDNLFAITAFNTLIQINQSHIGYYYSLIKVPIEIILGILLGMGSGHLFISFFKRHHVRDTKKVIIFLTVAILFLKIETILPFHVSGFIAIIVMGFTILENAESLAHRLSNKFSKIWILAEIVLFVLIGAQVNLSSLTSLSLSGLLLIFIGLAGRSIGVFVSLYKEKFTFGENLFCAISLTPKATLQATLGAIPLTLGLPHGDLILSLSVLSIIVTAPLGALGIRFSKKYL